MFNRLSKVDGCGNVGKEVHCSICPGNSICLCWRQVLSLQLEYADVVEALDCLDDVLEKPAWRFSLGGDRFCAHHAEDGFYYLLCREYKVLRLSEDESASSSL
jgi:hypothetical protein